jgi:hypothetical protein
MVEKFYVRSFQDMMPHLVSMPKFGQLKNDEWNPIHPARKYNSGTYWFKQNLAQKMT